jgi:hypothetical protein
MASDGILVSKQKYDAEVMKAAEEGRKLPPFEVWYKQQNQPTLAQVFNK